MNQTVHFFLVLILTFFSSGIKSQTTSKPNFDTMLGLSCSFSGQPSQVVCSFKKLIDAKSYSQIVRLLDEGNTAQQCLAVMTCEFLQNKGELNLSNLNRDKILFLYRSKEKVLICSGCLIGNSITLNELLTIRTKLSFSGNLRRWIQQSLEQ